MLDAFFSQFIPQKKFLLDQFYPKTLLMVGLVYGGHYTEWEFYYNWHRSHGSLNGDSPNDKVSKLSNITPFSDEVYDKYDKSKEHIQLQNYLAEMAIRELKNARKK